MNEFRPFWDDLGALTALQVAKRIKASCVSLEEFVPEPSIVQALEGRSMGRILDFGCGVGRQVLAFLQTGAEVVGFDNPAMIERAKERLGTHEGLTWTDCWEDVVSLAPYDAVVASLVFQHVPKNMLRLRLDALAQLTDRMLVLSRNAHDEGGAVSRLIVERKTWEEVSRIDEPPGSCHPGHWFSEFRSCRQGERG